MNQWKYCILKFLIKNQKILQLRPPTFLPKEITNYIRTFLNKQEMSSKTTFLFGSFNLNALDYDSNISLKTFSMWFFKMDS